MRLTVGRLPDLSSLAEHPPLTRRWAFAALTVALLAIAAIDRVTGAAPVQHLYYLPIIFAALRFGNAGGLVSAVAAIVLYHVANPHPLTLAYEESDFFQMGVFVAVGLVAAKLASDSRRLHGLASTDDLTGLHNLRSFEARLRSMIRSARKTKTGLAILVLDVDRLKSLNDTYGHIAGAEAVRTVGRILAEQLPPESAACRFGGDEFVIALRAGGKSEASRVAGELCRAVHAVAPVLAGIAFAAGTLSISVGVACRSFEETTALEVPAELDATGEALFRAADSALYVAKGGGRNRVSLA